MARRIDPDPQDRPQHRVERIHLIPIRRNGHVSIHGKQAAVERSPRDLIDAAREFGRSTGELPARIGRGGPYDQQAVVGGRTGGHLGGKPVVGDPGGLEHVARYVGRIGDPVAVDPDQVGVVRPLGPDGGARIGAVHRERAGIFRHGGAVAVVRGAGCEHADARDHQAVYEDCFHSVGI